jgi:hypothetical protein
MRRAAARAAPRRPKLQRRLRAPPDRTVAAMCRRHLYVGRICARPDMDLLRLRLRAAQTRSDSLRKCFRRQSCYITSIRGLAWAKARFVDCVATLYEETPSIEDDCVGCAPLELARWCASRARSPRELRWMLHEAMEYVADRRVHWLIWRRLTYFETE